jgi:hypothetical protein
VILNQSKGILKKVFQLVLCQCRLGDVNAYCMHLCFRTQRFWKVELDSGCKVYHQFQGMTRHQVFLMFLSRDVLRPEMFLPNFFFCVRDFIEAVCLCSINVFNNIGDFFF